MTQVPQFNLQSSYRIPVPDDKPRPEYLSGDEATRVRHDELVARIMATKAAKALEAKKTFVPNAAAQEHVLDEIRSSGTVIDTIILPRDRTFTKPACSWCGSWLRSHEVESGIHEHCAEVKERLGKS